MKGVRVFRTKPKIAEEARDFHFIPVFATGFPTPISNKFLPFYNEQQHPKPPVYPPLSGFSPLGNVRQQVYVPLNAQPYWQGGGPIPPRGAYAPKSFTQKIPMMPAVKPENFHGMIPMQPSVSPEMFEAVHEHGHFTRPVPPQHTQEWVNPSTTISQDFFSSYTSDMPTIFVSQSNPFIMPNTSLPRPMSTKTETSPSLERYLETLNLEDITSSSFISQGTTTSDLATTLATTFKPVITLYNNTLPKLSTVSESAQEHLESVPKEDRSDTTFVDPNSFYIKNEKSFYFPRPALSQVYQPPGHLPQDFTQHIDVNFLKPNRTCVGPICGVDTDKGDAARLGYIPPPPKLISEFPVPPTSTEYYSNEFIPGYARSEIQQPLYPDEVKIVEPYHPEIPKGPHVFVPPQNFPSPPLPSQVPPAQMTLETDTTRTSAPNTLPRFESTSTFTESVPETTTKWPKLSFTYTQPPMLSTQETYPQQPAAYATVPPLRTTTTREQPVVMSFPYPSPTPEAPLSTLTEMPTTVSQLPTTSVGSTITMPKTEIMNRIIGKVRVVCKEDGIEFSANTLFPFTGQIFANNRRRVPNCSHNIVNTVAPKVFLPFLECGVKNTGDQRDSRAQYHMQVVMVIQQPDGTSTVQSFMAQCVQQKIHYDKQTLPRRIEEALEELRLVPTKLEQKAPLPQIVIDEHNQLGPEVTEVDIGMPLAVQWRLLPESDSYGFHVKNCFVKDDIINVEHKMIDELGCSTDLTIFAHPHYDTYHDTASSHLWAFKPPFCPDLITSPPNSILYDAEGAFLKRRRQVRREFTQSVRAALCTGPACDPQPLQFNKRCFDLHWVAASTGLSFASLVFAIIIHIAVRLKVSQKQR
uniref:ZP domain-containing protein n=1 Tax=Angiostrongylus cantonensis TaxID=6313 RepID=A0A158PAG5_ANGCA